MSRSSPPPSPTAASPPRDDDDKATPLQAGNGPSLRRRLSLRLAALMRWVHIYLSMFSLAALLFFSVTGITLNHPDWFYGGAERSVQEQGHLDVQWLHLELPRGGAGEEADASRQVAKLEVVEHLRKAHGIRGALAEFRTDDRECMVTFKGPGYAADAFIDRATGRYELTETYHGLIAVINDLHKGRDTGKAWSLVIDLSAVLMTLISLTGLALLFYIKRRRLSGLVTALVGTVVVVAVVWLWVP
jgi:uncharacterized protein